MACLKEFFLGEDRNTDRVLKRHAHTYTLYIAIIFKSTNETKMKNSFLGISGVPNICETSKNITVIIQCTF